MSDPGQLSDDEVRALTEYASSPGADPEKRQKALKLLGMAQPFDVTAKPAGVDAAPPPEPSTPPPGDDRLPGETPEHYAERKDLENGRKNKPKALPDQMQPLAAFATMFPHGLSFGFNDDAAGWGYGLANEMAMGDQIPRAAGRGANAPLSGKTDAEAGRDIVNQNVNQARHDAPLAAKVGEGAGMMLGALPLTEALGMIPGMSGAGLETLPAVARVLARSGIGAVQGAAGGGLSGAGEADPGQRMQGADSGAEGGAVLGAALPAAFSLGGGALEAAGLRTPADFLEHQASRQRGLSSGPGAAQIEAMKEMKGPDAVAQLGRDMESTGLHEPGALPHSYEETETIAHGAMDTAGKDVAALRGVAGATSPDVDMRGVAQDMIAEATRLQNLGLPEADQAANRLLDKAQGIMQNPDRPYGDAFEFRKFIDDMAFDAEGQKSGVEAKRLRKIAGGVRQAMLDAADQSTTPGLRDAIEATNKRYETAARVYNNAKRGSAYEDASDRPSLGMFGRDHMISRGRTRAATARGLREAENVARATPDVAPAAAASMMNIPWFDVYADQSQEQR